MSYITLDTAAKLIKEFDGKTNLQEFIDSCDLTLESVRENDQQILFKIIKTKIVGKAKNLIKFRVFDDWDSLKEHLEESLTDKRSVAHWQLSLNTCTQRKGESIVTYSNRIENFLCNLIDATTVGKTKDESNTISEVLKSQALNIYLQGLVEPLKIHVKSRNPVTLEKAIEIARIEETELLSSRDSNKFYNYRNPNLQQNNKTCHICHKPGHLAAQCFRRNQTNPRNSRNNNFTFQSNKQIYTLEENVCRYCKKPGHRIADCRKRIYNEQNRANNSNSNNRNFNGSSNFQQRNNNDNFTSSSQRNTSSAKDDSLNAERASTSGQLKHK